MQPSTASSTMKTQSVQTTLPTSQKTTPNSNTGPIKTTHHIGLTNRFDCTGKVTGFYADPNSCSNYFICAGSQSLEVSCASGLLFNDVTKFCDLPSNVNCKGQQQVTKTILKTPSPSSSTAQSTQHMTTTTTKAPSPSTSIPQGTQHMTKTTMKAPSPSTKTPPSSQHVTTTTTVAPSPSSSNTQSTKQVTMAPSSTTSTTQSTQHVTTTTTMTPPPSSSTTQSTQHVTTTTTMAPPPSSSTTQSTQHVTTTTTMAPPPSSSTTQSTQHVTTTTTMAPPPSSSTTQSTQHVTKGTTKDPHNHVPAFYPNQAGTFCSTHGYGIHRDPADCGMFYQCGPNLEYHEQCPPGTVFNKAIQNCDHPSRVPECRNYQP
ncbi:mucin-2-like [Saccostrea echinata]|uniref:mucin-2-like n=1 Tax=Saccostrea echinata TaxID=191078 RepID=UPI002A80A60F|nr:mucin-2-like [Saccostrea echinata]